MSEMLKPIWDIDLDKVQYDMVLCALGYETRSSYAAEEYKHRFVDSKKIALGFNLNNCLAYPKNKEIIKCLDYHIIQCDDGELDEVLSCEFKLFFADNSPKIVLIDISSFSRYRLSKILEMFYRWSPLGSQIHFNYTIAEFEEPITSTSPITNLSPLSPFFAGAPSSPSKSLICIMGLGYEEDRAIGALEFLEIGEAVVFKPISLDRRYDLAVDKANKILLGDIQSEKVIRYEMSAPPRIYSMLDATIKGFKSDSRVITIPLGPKIFALMALLVSINNYPDMPIWSVSSVNDEPRDRKPSGKKIVFGAVKSNI